ncbi:putative phospholipid hydroperoxide glutathione peroxidase [Platanthera guangdongensis]|uniref:Phospholipid hydroperoxide glutathione peroxidase n=1 Tax=Platanthera guangdongensis TaxID=2320717 RepID=A0ABR2LBU4_9ASPA
MSRSRRFFGRVRSLVKNLFFLDAEKYASDTLFNCSGFFGDLIPDTLLNTVLLGQYVAEQHNVTTPLPGHPSGLWGKYIALLQVHYELLHSFMLIRVIPPSIGDVRGQDVDLSIYNGKVLLIVNVASKWYIG